MIKDVIGTNESVTPNAKEIEILKENFPSCFKADGSFDIERFKEFLNDKVSISHEGYELKFLGKSYAKMLAALDTETVIVPDEEHNSKPENRDSQNVYISGDNLDGLKHLLKSYAGQVKCIYIDPPYNTGTDGFTYSDNFHFTVPELMQKLDITEEQATRILDLTNRGSAAHSAWLMFMYPRLQLARDLLSADGVIFISIDDNEQANLKLICDDIFGENNMIANIVVQSNKRGQTYKQLAKTHEYLLVYTIKPETILNELSKGSGAFSLADDIGEFEERELRNRNPKYGKFNRPNLFYPIYVNPYLIDSCGDSPISLTQSENYTVEVYPFNSEGEESCWRWGKKKFEANNNENSMQSEVVGRKKSTGEYGIYEKYRKGTFKAKTIWYNDDVIGELPDEDDDIWEETGVITEQGSTELGKYNMGSVFDFPKPTYLIKKVFTIGGGVNDTFVDFFSGSATSTEALMRLNVEDGGSRRIIAVQLPENLDEKYQNASKSDKAKFKGMIDFVDELGYPHTLDYIGFERIIRAASKIKEENPDINADLGFKHYTLQAVSENTLDKMEKFDGTGFVVDDTIYNIFGTNTIITTWLVHDGYQFINDCRMIDLAGYTAYWCKNHLYLTTPEMTEEAIKALIDKYNTEGDFNPQNIVVFGYSFNYVNMENLKTNVKILRDGAKNLKVNLDVRY
jgi:hypothetical protein